MTELQWNKKHKDKYHRECVSPLGSSATMPTTGPTRVLWCCQVRPGYPAMSPDYAQQAPALEKLAQVEKGPQPACEEQRDSSGVWKAMMSQARADGDSIF